MLLSVSFQRLRAALEPSASWGPGACRVTPLVSLQVQVAPAAASDSDARALDARGKRDSIDDTADADADVEVEVAVETRAIRFGSDLNNLSVSSRTNNFTNSSSSK